MHIRLLEMSTSLRTICSKRDRPPTISRNAAARQASASMYTTHKHTHTQANNVFAMHFNFDASSRTWCIMSSIFFSTIVARAHATPQTTFSNIKPLRLKSFAFTLALCLPECVIFAFDARFLTVKRAKPPGLFVRRTHLAEHTSKLLCV